VTIEQSPRSVDPSDTIRASVRSATYSVFVLFAGSIPAEYSLVLPVIGSVTRLLGALLILLVAVDIMGGRRLRAPVLPLALLVAFVTWSVATLIWSVEPSQTLARVVTYAQLLLMGWIAFEYVRTCEQFNQVLQWFVAGSLLVACVTIRDFSLTSVATFAVSELRVAAFGANPNELGLAMAITVPAALFLLRQQPRGVSLVLNGAYLLVGPIAVMLTASRGAVVVLVLVMLGMLVMMRDMKWWAKVAVAASMFAVGTVGVLLVPSNTWERVASVGMRLQRMDLNNRTGNWEAGFEYFLGQPLLGVGAGAFQGAARHMKSTSWSSHSTWVGVLVETGIVGAALWFSAVALILWGLLRVPAPVRRMLYAMIGPMLVGMLVTGWDHRKVPWFLLALAMVAPTLFRGVSRVRPVSPQGLP
jgi:O-antigen ligase